MAIQFEQEYRLLELDTGANWSIAQANYRRLVHAWHPDRYAHRPREKMHAQSQFIELTKAFNHLRSFYRQNHRLPFEQIKQAIADPPEPETHQQIRPEDGSINELSILNKRKPSTKLLKPSLLKILLWVIPAFATVAAGCAVFFIIDRNTKQNAIEEAKRVLRTVQPSEYMANTEELTKATNRANIVNPVEGNRKMGDKLAKDLFK